MHVRLRGCESVLWGISFLITYMIILTILSTFTAVQIFCQYTENYWENCPNVQGKENLSAQYAVKFVPRPTAPCICARAFKAKLRGHKAERGNLNYFP